MGRIHGFDVGMGALPEPSTHEAMEVIARRQVAFFQHQDPAMIIGGRLLIAELTRDYTMTIKTQCVLSGATNG